MQQYKIYIWIVTEQDREQNPIYPLPTDTTIKTAQSTSFVIQLSWMMFCFVTTDRLSSSERTA